MGERKKLPGTTQSVLAEMQKIVVTDKRNFFYFSLTWLFL
jgi:hypothetical protein